MPRRIPAAAAILIALLSAGALPAAAQPVPPRAPLSTHALFSAGNGPRCTPATGFVSNASWRGASVAVLPARFTTLGLSTQGAPVASLAYASPARHAWRIAVDGAVGPAERDCAFLSERSRGAVVLSRAIGAGGVQITAAGRSLSSLDPSRDRHGIAVGAWRSVRGALVTLEMRGYGSALTSYRRFSTTQSFLDTVRNDSMPSGIELRWRSREVADSSASRAESDLLDLRGRVQWAHGRLALDLTAGGSSATVRRRDSLRADSGSGGAGRSARDRVPVRLWGRFDARYALSSMFEIVGGYALLPREPLTGASLASAPGRRIAMLGIGISGLPRGVRDGGPSGGERPVDAASGRPPAAAFEALRDDSAGVRLRVRVPGASRIEITGELTGWQPVPMRSVGDGWWEVGLRTPSGTYRMNIRVDGGAWTAPPGVPSVRDEFGGAVGLVPIG